MELQGCHAGTLPVMWSTWRNVEAIDLAYNRLSGASLYPTGSLSFLHGNTYCPSKLCQALCLPCCACCVMTE